MIDNFDLIKKFFYFSEENNMFFHLQIVRRAKDHKGEKVKEAALRTYFIRSKEHLERVKGEIILLCEYYGARAYINIAGKHFLCLQNLMLAKLAEYNFTHTLMNPRKVLNSAAGELKSAYPKWVVDIDNIEDESKVFEWLCNNECRPTRIPTISCCHFITSKFNLEAFKKEFPDIDVHKNSIGTILYVPDIVHNKYNNTI